MNDALLWILVFLFRGQPMTAGPFALDDCLRRAGYEEFAHCWNVESGQREYADFPRGGAR